MMSLDQQKREKLLPEIYWCLRKRNRVNDIKIRLSCQGVHQQTLCFLPIGADLLMKENIYEKISTILKREKNSNIIINSIRTISALCKSNSERVNIFIIIKVLLNAVPVRSLI